MTIAEVLAVIRSEQILQRGKLNEIHAAVLAVGSGGGNAEVLQRLQDILDAVTIPGEPEASPELLAIVERAVATALTTRELANQLKALGSE